VAAVQTEALEAVDPAIDDVEKHGNSSAVLISSFTFDRHALLIHYRRTGSLVRREH
jgi:hypothetical protein